MSATDFGSQMELSRIVRLISGHVPDLLRRSTIGIVGSRNKVIRQIGTGTLLAVADHRFVVTAAHVVHEARRNDLTIGVSGAEDGYFLGAAASWVVSMVGDNPFSSDPFDVAIYEFSAEQAARLSASNFVRIGDVGFDDDLSSGYFLVTGFPAMWSTTLTETDANVAMNAKMLQYGTCVLQGSVTGLADYNPKIHFLLEASPAALLDHTGEAVTFRTASGHRAQMPHDLRGVSGCSVWMIGDLTRPIETWSQKASRLVGIETGVYADRSAIKVTRWKAVVTLLYNHMPTLRPVLELHMRT